MAAPSGYLGPASGSAPPPRGPFPASRTSGRSRQQVRHRSIAGRRVVAEQAWHDVHAPVKRWRLERHLPFVDITMNPPTATMEDVVARAQRGESDAFSALVDSHHAELVRIAYVVSGDIELARDAAQSAWVKAWRKLPGLRDPARLRVWLIAITANEARQMSRARRRRSLREAQMPIDFESGGWLPERFEPFAEPSSAPVDLAHALARLDAEDRALIAMRYLAGLGSDEIGARHRALGVGRPGPSQPTSRASSPGALRCLTTASSPTSNVA